jgi:hypothetical protein
MPARMSTLLVSGLIAVALGAGCARHTEGRIALDCPGGAQPQTRPFDGGLLHACVDAAGRDHGPQRAIADAGHELFTGHFVRGEPNGIARIAVLPDRACCLWEYAFDNGQPLWRRGRGRDGQLYSEWVYDGDERASVRRWHANGAQSDAFEIVEGELEGRWLRWWPNGQRQRESSWRHGQLEGDFREWYANGQPRLVGRYVGNRRAGDWQVWSEAGTPIDPPRDFENDIGAAPR